MAKIFAAATNVEFDIHKEITTGIDRAPGKVMCLFWYSGRPGRLTRVEAAVAKDFYVVDDRPLATLWV